LTAPELARATQPLLIRPAAARLVAASTALLLWAQAALSEAAPLHPHLQVASSLHQPQAHPAPESFLKSLHWLRTMSNVALNANSKYQATPTQLAFDRLYFAFHQDAQLPWLLSFSA
jgi:hypothetical protein